MLSYYNVYLKKYQKQTPCKSQESALPVKKGTITNFRTEDVTRTLPNSFLRTSSKLNVIFVCFLNEISLFNRKTCSYRYRTADVGAIRLYRKGKASPMH